MAKYEVGLHPRSADFSERIRAALPEPFATFLVGICCASAVVWDQGGICVCEISNGMEISWVKGFPSSDRKLREFFSYAFGNRDLKFPGDGELAVKFLLEALGLSFASAEIHLETECVQETWAHTLHILISSPNVDRIYINLFWSVD